MCFSYFSAKSVSYSVSQLLTHAMFHEVSPSIDSFVVEYLSKQLESRGDKAAVELVNLFLNSATESEQNERSLFLKFLIDNAILTNRNSIRTLIESDNCKQLIQHYNSLNVDHHLDVAAQHQFNSALQTSLVSFVVYFLFIIITFFNQTLRATKSRKKSTREKRKQSNVCQML